MPPLQGLRILDLTNVMAGPFCCYQLAMLGAEVIKVEVPRTGDLARQLGADQDLSRIHMGASFLAQNAGKKSVTLNLKDARGRELFYKLVTTADAVVEAYRPGVTKRLGIDAATLRKDHPKLVYCSLSGFGQNGPLSQRPAYDQIIQGMAGLMAVTGDEETAPLRVGFPISDAAAGLNAAVAVCGALVRAARTGEGSTIDVSMLDSSLTLSAWVVSNWLIAGEPPRPMGNENRTAAPSGAYKTGQGLLNIAANKQDQWVAFARAAGLEHLLKDPRFEQREARKANRAALKLLVEEALSRRSAAEWEIILNEVGVPAGCVLSVEDAVSQEQVAHRALFTTFPDVEGVDRPVTVATSGFLFPDEGRVPITPPARLGAHNDEILRSLGLSELDIKQLHSENVI